MASSGWERITGQRWLVLVFQSMFAAIAVVLLASFWGDAGDDPEAFLWRMAAFYTAHTVWAFWSWRVITRRWIDAYSIFLLSLVLFSGGHLILHALGLLPRGVLDGAFGERTLRRTVVLVVASLAAFHLGAVLRASTQRLGERRLQPGEPGVLSSGMYRWVGYAFLAAALPAALMQTFRSIQLVASSGYIALYQQQTHFGLDNWEGVMASFFLPGLLIVLATRPDRRLNVRLCWFLAIGSIAVNLFYGTRAAAVMALLPMLMLHDLLVRRIRPTIVFALVVGSLIAIPVIGYLRDMNLKDRIAATQTDTVFAPADATAAVREMGGSMATVAYTIELVPRRRAIENGMGYVRAATTVFPNLFWDVHPAARAGTYSQWLIREVDRYVFEAGGGLGFSMIAEAYLNASWWGAPLVMLVAGFLLAAFVGWARNAGDAVHYTLEAMVVSAVLMLPRGESTGIFRPVVWTALVPYLVARYAARGRAPISRPEPSGTGAHDDVEPVQRSDAEPASPTWR